MGQAVGSYIAGALFQGVIAGVLTWIVLTILNVPFAAPLAVLVGLFDLIPMVGATITEGIFNVPGVGNTLYQAIIRGEGPTVVSFVTVMVLIYLGVNLLVDLFYGLLDPRIRYVK